MIPPNATIESLLATFAKLVAVEIVAAQKATVEPAPMPRLTTDEACRELKISKAKLLRLRDEGAPTHYVGQSPRWDLSELEAWLDARGPKGAPSKPKKDGDVVVLKSRGAQ